MSIDEMEESLEAIAVIGMACRFPGAANIEAFWKNLCSGLTSTRFFTEEELLAAGEDKDLLHDPNFVAANGVVEDIHLFDADLFAFSPREAEITDPQHRIFLETAWEALENAGYGNSAKDSRVATYAGCADSTYFLNNLAPNKQLLESVGEFPLLIGNNRDHVATRTNFKLNLHGPAVSVGTACSSSLVAVHLACESLRNYEAEMALAGAVSLRIPQIRGYLYGEGSVNSRDGYCRAFDAQASGTVSGNGVGVVLLKRLGKALEDRDNILAVIRGSAMNNDGSDKVGYTAPSVMGQTDVILNALAAAEVEADTVGYVEAHGTGTLMGDPIEIEALNRSYGFTREKSGTCLIGSVKTNVGHLDEAAGMAGLIKTILILQHGKIPPSLHYSQPNPSIAFEYTPFKVNQKLTVWPQGDFPRRAGVSSFGIGGTNVHMILEEAPSQDVVPSTRGPHLFVLSGKSEQAVADAAENLVQFLEGNHVDLSHAAYTLAAGRKRMEYRRCFVSDSQDGMIAALKAQGSSARVKSKPQIAFLFPGQGSQKIEATRHLYRDEPVFREYLDKCATGLLGELNHDIRSLLYPITGQVEEARTLLNQTHITQPVLFSVEYALAQLWRSWQLEPDAMIGHSIGEYVAACLAGVFTLETALEIVAERGRRMAAMQPGSMMAVACSWDELQANPSLDLSPLALASENATHQIVVSGFTADISRLREQLESLDITHTLLNTQHAFHSPLMDQAAKELEHFLEKYTFNPPNMAFVSNVSGTWITVDQATSPHYWSQHISQCVRFESGLTTLLTQDVWVTLEMGPGRTLSNLVDRHPLSGNALSLNSLPHVPGADELSHVLNTVGLIWQQGADICWDDFYRHKSPRRIPLPSYPFQRKPYWIEAPKEKRTQSVPMGDLQKPGNWLYTDHWSPKSLKQTFTPPEDILVFEDELGCCESLFNALKKRHANWYKVTPGKQFRVVSSRQFTLNPDCYDDYVQLIKVITQGAKLPRHIVHAQNVTPAGMTATDFVAPFYGFHHLIKALDTMGEASVPMTLTVLCSGLHQITGDEILVAERAALAGMIRVLPLEYSGLKARAIEFGCEDISKGTWGDQVLDEWGHTEPLVAYRGGERFVPQLRPYAETAGPIRDFPKTWLITGGLGSMGLAFAEYLAKEKEANLVLVGRELLPPKSMERHWLPSQEDGLENESAYMQRQFMYWNRRLNITGISDIHGLEADLNLLCSALVLNYFKRRGLNTAAGISYERSQLKYELGVIPKLEKFLDFFIDALLQDQILYEGTGWVTFVEAESIAEHEKIYQRMVASYPSFKGLFDLLYHCGMHFDRALSGEMPAIQVLYPEGNNALLDSSAASTAEHDNDRVLIHLLRDILLRRNAGATNPLRILEVGGGAGLMSGALLERLRHTRVDYHFTDISPAFVGRARDLAEASGIHNMSFSVFDICKDPREQGLKLEDYDVVLGYNVVHATENVDQAVENIKSLLKPGGLLAMVETVMKRRWVDLIWGLAEGWWYFNDGRDGSPLLSPQQWEERLRALQFSHVQAWPQRPEERKTSEASLILAMRDGSPYVFHDTEVHLKELQEKATRLARIKAFAEASGARVSVCSADVGDAQELALVIDRAREQFGPIEGVIHTAGYLGQGLQKNKSRDEMDRVFATKVGGARNLERLIPEMKQLILCSSLSAVTPVAGQADYSGANGVLDTLACQLTQANRCRTVSIAWGFWQELGMIRHSQVDPRVKAAIEEEIESKGWQNMGVALFDYILHHVSEPRVYVSPHRLDSPHEPVSPLLVASSKSSVEKNSVDRSIPISHPMLKKGFVADGHVQFCASLRQGRYWVLDEHRVYGKSILPGTAYMDLIWSAVKAYTGKSSLCINDLFFQSPLVVSDGEERELRVLLKEETEQRLNVRVISGFQGRWLEHARCDIHLKNMDIPGICDIQTLCHGASIQMSDGSEPFERRMAGYPLHWRCLKQAWFGDENAVAHLQLSPEALSDMIFPLQPGLLDIATGYLSSWDQFEDGLPFCYEKILIFDQLTESCYSHIRRSPNATQDAPCYDIDIYDEEGRPLMAITGYVIRRLRGVGSQDQDEQDLVPENCRLEITIPGLLDTLCYREAPRVAPGDNDVEIEVYAAGLNFIEVLYALGMLPAPPNAAPGFGLECSGRIVRTGSKTGFAVGDEVMALAPACFSCFTTLPARSVVLKPAPLTLLEAACSPSAYTTAWYALITKAQLRKGETILIHSATGGVGLAAVHIARMVGAKVFATAGTPEKRAWLKQMGIEHVMNSRDLSFAQEIMTITGGKGLDVALNSLGGDFIPATLGVLGLHGRFVELGKRDIFNGTRLDLTPFSKYLSYFAVDVGPDMPFFEEVFQDVFHHLNNGFLPPLEHRVFPMETPEDAFQFMAAARHIGKLVVGPVDRNLLLAKISGDDHGVPLEHILGTEVSVSLNSGSAREKNVTVKGAGGRPDLEVACVLPSTPEEYLLAEIWEDLLGIQGIGVNDNFFDLRGDSLLAAQIISRVHRKCGFRLPPSILFDEPTIAQLAQRLVGASEADDEDEDGEI